MAKMNKQGTHFMKKKKQLNAIILICDLFRKV